MTKPISLHTENSHYFIYKERPTILVTSAEHYGAVLNKAFNYVKYLKELSQCGNNLTRVFIGTQRESQDLFGVYNTLAPAPADFVCPYKRSNVPGSNDGLNKFDLDSYDETFFSRLCAFMDEALRQDVIVELTFFCPFYHKMQADVTWELSPYHPSNNINGIGNGGCDTLFTLEELGLTRYQTELIRKLVEVLNPYDNLMFEIINEPYHTNATGEFLALMSGTVIETETLLPKKHLITQNISNGYSGISKVDPNISVFNFHYSTPPCAVEINYFLNKAIGCNETAIHGNDYTYRRQAWEFIMAGGSLFNNLDFSFSVGNENGDETRLYSLSGGNRLLRKQYGFLRRFVEDMDFIKMYPANDLIYSLEYTECDGQGYLLAEPGRQYAFYLSKSSVYKGSFIIEEGRYLYKLFNPATCTCVEEKIIEHKGGELVLSLELHKIQDQEIAIRLMRKI